MATHVPLIAAVVTALLAGIVALRSRSSRLHATLALGLGALAVESLVAWGLLAWTWSPETRHAALLSLQSAGAFVNFAWALFIVTLLPIGAAGSVTRWVVAGGTLLATGLPIVASVMGVRAFVVAEHVSAFQAATLDTAGIGAAAVQLVVTVGILVGLETALRTSDRVSRWRIKYLILGLGGVFLMRFYFLSQIVLFRVVMASYLTTEAAVLLVGNAFVAGSLLRDRMLGVELTVSRHVLTRSVVVGALGLYVLSVGVVGAVLNGLGIAEELFWGSVVIFVAAVSVGALVLSEDVRWRVKQFIGLHFYRSKYDYRQQWMTFTRRLGSLVTIEELAPQLIAAVADAVGTARAALYLPDGNDASFHHVASVEITRVLVPLPAEAPLLRRVREATGPVVLATADVGDLLPAPLPAIFPSMVVAIPLFWRDALIGLMLIGPERTGRPYVVEDTDFLATMGQHSAGLLVAARFSEALAQSREFEAFHRLSSFVIHDLKNSISALSLLSDNALANFDDPEFQRDALRTLARTVDRQKALLARLAAAPAASTLAFAPVDLALLIDDATAAVKGTARIRIVKELAALPPVSADGEALLQVVQNLIQNGIDALDGNGTLTVRTYRDGGRVALEVTDTGCGMPDEFVRKSLFTPFRSTKKGGWGIGLYQAKGIVEGHGGAIEVTSRQGEGTTFRVKLPAAAPAEAISR